MAADRALAVPVNALGESAEVVVFELGSLRFALPSAQVDELAQAFAFDPLPGAPGCVAGAANLRGQVVPVIDLRSRFRLAPKPLDVADHFVVARAGARRVLLHVDRAVDLRTVSLREFDAGSDAGQLVSGAGTVEDGILFIYDLAGLLSEAEGLALDQALSELQPEAEA